MTRATRTPPGPGAVVPAARLVVPAPGDDRIESPANRGGVTIGSAALSGVDTPDAVRAVTPTRTQIPEEVADLVRGGPVPPGQPGRTPGGTPCPHSPAARTPGPA